MGDSHQVNYIFKVVLKYRHFQLWVSPISPDVKNGCLVFGNFSFDAKFYFKVCKLETSLFDAIAKNLDQVNAAIFIAEFPIEKFFAHTGVRAVAEYKSGYFLQKLFEVSAG